MEKIFLDKIHKRLSIVSVGASALRNQGSSGIVKIARNYFYTISIDEFISSVNNQDIYILFLNSHTNNLLKKFPKEAQSWGAARKGLNLFFREIIYNKFFSDFYNLPKEIDGFNETFKFLEVPLDLDVATGIYNNRINDLPKWTSIKRLTP